VEIKLLTHVIETLQQSPGIHRVEAQCWRTKLEAWRDLFSIRDFSAIPGCLWGSG
jgi:hypothetical protein